MRVVVDEPWCNEATASVDDTSSCGAGSLDLSITADAEEPLASHSQRLRARAQEVHRPDSRVADDEVGVLGVEPRRPRDQQRCALDVLIGSS